MKNPPGLPVEFVATLQQHVKTRNDIGDLEMRLEAQ